MNNKSKITYDDCLNCYIHKMREHSVDKTCEIYQMNQDLHGSDCPWLVALENELRIFMNDGSNGGLITELFGGEE